MCILLAAINTTTNIIIIMRIPCILVVARFGGVSILYVETNGSHLFSAGNFSWRSAGYWVRMPARPEDSRGFRQQYR